MISTSAAERPLPGTELFLASGASKRVYSHAAGGLINECGSERVDQSTASSRSSHFSLRQAHVDRSGHASPENRGVGVRNARALRAHCTGRPCLSSDQPGRSSAGAGGSACLVVPTELFAPYPALWFVFGSCHDPAPAAAEAFILASSASYSAFVRCGHLHCFPSCS